MKLYGIDISANSEKRIARNPFKTFQWQVIDKTNRSSHPLWFRSFEDLVNFYKSRERMWKEFADDLRIVKTDDIGNEIERYAFEI